MPQLTITSNDAGVTRTIRALNSTIQKSENVTVKVAAVTKTIESHWNAALAGARRYEQQVNSVVRTTRELRDLQRGLGRFGSAPRGGFGSAGNGAAEQERAARAAERAAKATQASARASQQQARNALVVANSYGRAANSVARIRRDLSRIRPIGRDGSFGAPRIGGGGGVIDVTGSSRIVGTGGAAAGGIGKVISDAIAAGGRTFVGLARQASGLIGGAISALGGAGGPIAGIASTISGGLVSGLGNAIGGALQTGIRIAQGALTGAFVAAAAAGAFSLQRAIAAEPVQQSFNAVAQNRGLGNPQEVLGGLRGASRGTLSDRDLQLNASRALFLGAAETREEIELLIDAGRRLGKGFGRDAKEGFEDLALGIGRQSKLILDNLGLNVELGAANRALARDLGKTTEQLTDQERKLAFNRAAYSAIIQGTRDLGKEQLTTSDQIARLGASVSNLGAAIGREALPQVSALIERWSKFLSTVDPKDVVAGIRRGATAVAGGAGRLLDSVLGRGNARQQVGDFGSSIVSSLTDPSAANFDQLFLQVRGFYDKTTALAEFYWSNFLNFGLQAFDSIRDNLNNAIREGFANGLGSIAENIVKNTPVGILTDRLLGGDISGLARSAVESLSRFTGPGALIEGQQRAVGAGQDRILAAVGLDLGSASENLRAATERLEQRLTAIDARTGRGSATPRSASDGDSGATTSSDVTLVSLSRSSTEASASVTKLGDAAEREEKVLQRHTQQTADLVDAQKAEKEAKEAEAAARKEQIDSIESGIRTAKEQQNAQRDLIRIAEQEANARRRRIQSLEGAGAGLGRARAGIGPSRSLEQRARELADTLRSFPATFEDIRERLAVEGQALADSIKAAREAETKARRELAESIRNAGRDFLRGGPRDGETVRVRAARRRFQRDERRAQNEVINNAFRSGGFDGGINLGGFGAQGIQRRGSLGDFGPFAGLGFQGFGQRNPFASANALFRGNPEAEQAARGLETLADGGQITDAANALRETIEEQTRIVEEQREEIAALLEEEKEQTQAQADAQAEATRLHRQIIEAVESQTRSLRNAVKDIKSNQDHVARIERDLKDLDRQLRALR